MNRVAPIAVILVLISISFLACGGYSSSVYKPPSGLFTRVFASQSISGPTSAARLVIINGSNDTLARSSGISAGNAPGLMAISPERSTLLVFDAATNSVQIVNAKTESLAGAIALSGPTTSMVAPTASFGYAAVPQAVQNGSPPGAVQVMNLTAGGIVATISVPSAQTVVASPNDTELFVFSNDSDAVTIVSPFSLNTGNPTTTLVSGFDRPVNAVFGGDGNIYILNCGPECGSASASASVQILNMTTTPPSAGAKVAVDGATIGWVSGSTLYVVGTPTASAGNSSPNNLCTGQTTAAPTCGRLDTVDLGSLTVTGSAVITDGYHDRIDMSVDGQLFIGSRACSNVGNVIAPQGEVRGCLSIFDPATAAVVIPPDNGDVTGLQSFTSRKVEYVVEGGNLRVYDTTVDKLLITSFITTGTVGIVGQVTDVKAVDFF